MKILAVSDEECKALWDNFQPGRLDGYELILSCGDLKSEYLTFLVTMSKARLLYIHGNHDTSYDRRPPEGCEDIDGSLIEYSGVRILGLGGCMRYDYEEDHQYTEREMAWRIFCLRHAIKKCGGVDIIITHAPPKGYGDMPDEAHRGYECFVKLIDDFHPQLFLHGHTHLRYDPSIPREHLRGSTRIINVSERFTFDIPDKNCREKTKGDIIWKTKKKKKGLWDIY